MLSVTIKYAKGHYAEYNYAECHYADNSYAECHYAEYSYAECCGTVLASEGQTL
jgi:hypothetical protein